MHLLSSQVTWNGILLSDCVLLGKDNFVFSCFAEASENGDLPCTVHGVGSRKQKKGIWQFLLC